MLWKNLEWLNKSTVFKEKSVAGLQAKTMASRMKFKSTFNIQEELARLSNPMPKIADPEDLAECMNCTFLM